MLNSNSVYTFQNAGSGKMLNLYGSASDGKNVVQYTADGSDEQRWKYTGNKLLTMRNTNFALDRYRGSGSYNNADVWTESSSENSDQCVYIRGYSDGTCHIVLASTLGDQDELRLTAYGSGNGTASGKSSTSNGNVFWAAPTYDDYQTWYYTEEGSSDSGSSDSNPYSTLGWNYIFDDLTNSFGYYGYNPPSHYGIDVICNEGIPIYSPANATVYAVGGKVRQSPDNPNADISGTAPGTTMGYYVVLKMDDLDPRTEKPLYVRFLHMQDIPPVSYGARVHAGTLLGYVGNTGRSDVAHLHLDINTKNNYQYSGEGFSNDNTINPVNFFPNVQFPANYYQNGCY